MYLMEWFGTFIYLYIGFGKGLKSANNGMTVN